jgi:mannitol 2-dehydrogenase
MTLLNANTMGSLGLKAQLPLYDRSAVRAGIVHVGVGGFHRAHQAMYIDDLLNKGEALEWGICGIGLLPRDAHMRDVLRAQDCLYTLVLKYPDGRWEPRVIGALVDYLYAPDDPDAVIEKMAGPSVRIVSLTVTEGGYNIDPVTHQFDLSVPAVAADLHNDQPVTVFGFVTEALARRRRRGVAPFTVMSCDNVAGNGHVARQAFIGFARAKDPDLADWLENCARFPNSMVDRITPQTTDEDRAAITERFGIVDGWPVVAEPFSQWVLEDSFSVGRPRYEDAGVQVVDDVEPYEMMKLRLLNAGHQVLGCLGHLAGYRMLHDVAQDPLFADLLMGYLDHEATPTLRPVPGIDLSAYKLELLVRFSNASTGDTVARICTDVSDRIPTFLVPVVRDQLASGGEVGRGVAVVAGWARYCEATDEQGQPIEINDRRRDSLVAAARAYGDDPLSFVRQRDLFGDLAEDPRFSRPYLAVLASLHDRGARWTIANLGTLV